MVLGQPEWKKYKPTTKTTYVKTPVEWGISGGAKGTGYYQKEVVTTIPAYDVPTITGYKPRVDPSLRYGKFTAPTTISRDYNGANHDDGIPSKFTSPEFWTGRKEPSIPSREQFVSEGGIWGEGAGVGAGAEEGLAFGEEKEGFDWGFWLLIGGIILLFIIVAVF